MESKIGNGYFSGIRQQGCGGRWTSFVSYQEFIMSALRYLFLGNVIRDYVG